uniref:C2H2-type domain-containing protein n=1 Tax=Panagrolaimus superbus TaxID=310955 RepID=A0A914YNH9_9BILA
MLTILATVWIIYFEDFEHLVQKDSLNVIETATSENFWNNVNRPELVENEEGLFVCPEEPCIGTFVNNSDLQSHLHIGIHIFSKGNQADYAMKRFKKRLEEMVSDQSTLSRDNVVHIALSQFSGAENVLAHYPRGWALVEEKKTVKRFTEDQKAFMTELYDRGVKNSKDKVRPEEAETMMKSAQKDGEPRFTVAEVLNKKQIKSFFGNIRQEKEGQNNTTRT